MSNIYINVSVLILQKQLLMLINLAFQMKCMFKCVSSVDFMKLTMFLKKDSLTSPFQHDTLKEFNFSFIHATSFNNVT